MAGTGDDVDRCLFGLGGRENGIRRQLQRFAQLHMIGIAEAVQRDQIARTDLIFHGDFSERLSLTHPVTPRPGCCCCSLAGDLEATADFHVVGVLDAVETHQRIHRDVITRRNVGQRFSGTDGHRCSRRGQWQKGRQGKGGERGQTHALT